MFSYEVINLGGDNNLELARIPAGDFLMGSSENELDREVSETPQHPVSVSEFWMGKYPVTQAQWKEVAGFYKVESDLALDLDPDMSYFKGNNRPVEQVSWYEAVEFCSRLSKYTGKDFRLPSEAEWEYACRARAITRYHFGPKISKDFANYRKPDGVASSGTSEVGKLKANDFGLYDMHGNVWEWCEDAWRDNYDGAPTDGGAWEIGGDASYRVCRGGSWGAKPSLCRSASRLRNDPYNRDYQIGFRVCCSAPRTP